MQQAPCGTGPVRKKARIVSQLTIEEVPEEEVTGEVAVMEEIAATEEVVAEVVVDEDMTMQDACYESSLSYLARRLGLVGFWM